MVAVKTDHYGLLKASEGTVVLQEICATLETTRARSSRQYSFETCQEPQAG